MSLFSCQSPLRIDIILKSKQNGQYFIAWYFVKFLIKSKAGLKEILENNSVKL